MRVLKEFADAELTAVCNPFAESREKVGDGFSVARRCETVEEMLDAAELDVTVVATPAHLNINAQTALPCLKWGIDTLTENPPGPNLNETHTLQTAAQRISARGIVGWNRRFDPYVKV